MPQVHPILLAESIPNNKQTKYVASGLMFGV